MAERGGGRLPLRTVPGRVDTMYAVETAEGAAGQAGEVTAPVPAG